MPVPMLKSFAEKTGKSLPELESKWEEAKAIASKEHSEKDNDYYKIVVGILKKMIGLNEDAGGGAPAPTAATTTSNIAINPGAGGSMGITKRKRIEPDGLYGEIPYFDVDFHNFSNASRAKLLKQRYNFTDQRVNDFLKDTNWSKPFILKHKDHMVKVGKY